MVGLDAVKIRVGSLPFNDTALPNRSVAASRFERPRKPRLAGFEYASQVVGHGIQHERRMWPQATGDAICHVKVAALQQEQKSGDVHRFNSSNRERGRSRVKTAF